MSLAHCVGGPYDGQEVPGVSQWVAWIPRDDPAAEASVPPRNLPPSDVFSHSHYASVGIQDGKITYVWREVKDGDAH